jgi:serine/threonine protein kinase
MLARGDSFGAYRIVARLKAGGMAQLYLARREGAAGFKRPVALKVIHPHLAREDQFVSMFVDEATLSSKIHDPNVVHVEDLGHANGGLFLAMEYVHGTALANVLRAARMHNRWLAPSFVAYIAAQIASGLHAAHEVTDDSGRLLGIVHRDVSPQNVLIAFKGHVKVIDFGIAKALGGTHATLDGAITGKLAYMPPEQARGHSLDRRADVYALGIVTWEMLTGRRLFTADNDLALIAQVREPKIDAPSKYVPNLPRSLDEVVMAMLARDPRSRPATTLDVKRMLLDAVPEARSVEAHDVAALLRALLAEQISAQDKVLASADLGSEPDRGSGSGISGPAASGPELSDLEVAATMTSADFDATDRIVEPADALHQLTVPAVVVPSPHRRANPSSASGGDAAPMAIAQPGGSTASSFSFVLVGVLVLILGGTAFAFKKLRAPAAEAGGPSAVATEQLVGVPAVPVGVDTAAPASAAPSEPAPVIATSATATTTPPKPAASERKRPTVKAPARPAAATSAATPAKPHCRMVGGMELCE